MYMPHPAAPAMARPTMKLLMSGAPPHRAEPAMNTAVLPMYSFFAEKVPYALDQIKVVAADARAKATPSQGTRATWPKVRTTLGWTLATTVLSKA